MEFNKNHLTVYSNLPQADYEGWLSKQESTKFLKKWFSLKGNILFYFQKSSDKEPLGIIILEGCSIELDECNNEFGFRIAFLGPQNKSLILIAEDHDSRIQWFTALSTANFSNMKYHISELQRQLDKRNKTTGLSFDCASYEIGGHIIKVDRFGNVNRATPFEDIERDIHGNFQDILVFQEVFWKMGPKLSPCALVFLGDYVDRGNYSCEVVAYLFAQKILNPQKVFLLRGNHEDRNIQKSYSFYKECLEKFKNDGYLVWEMINQVFDVMPIAGIIDKSIFVCHGGIPSPSTCPAVEVINDIPCPLQNPTQDSFLARELMWNDPVRPEYMSEEIMKSTHKQGFIFNLRRGTGHCFTGEALDLFLKINDLSHVIRAHEVKSVGFQIQQGGKLLTVFSSSGYCGGVNEAACILLEGKKIRIIQLNTS
uniref:Serine/threonine-protein phosphatase n=1 Tax=Clastoptera arizonana TaxID=38151 RepID=A0A1B6DPL7_9HEMI